MLISLSCCCTWFSRRFDVEGCGRFLVCDCTGVASMLCRFSGTRTHLDTQQLLVFFFLPCWCGVHAPSVLVSCVPVFVAFSSPLVEVLLRFMCNGSPNARQVALASISIRLER
ncbi:unnamed protein product, partial [Ectocarpus sp. 8 AP-2014]